MRESIELQMSLLLALKSGIIEQTAAHLASCRPRIERGNIDAKPRNDLLIYPAFLTRRREILITVGYLAKNEHHQKYCVLFKHASHASGAWFTPGYLGRNFTDGYGTI